MKIFIANLPYKLKEAELKQMLTQYGQVASVKLITDKETGKRKGFGFIEMPVSDQAQKAIDGLNGKKVDGREIALSVTVEKGYNNQPVFNNKRQSTKKEATGNEDELTRPDEPLQ